MAKYKKPKKNLHRGFFYLDDNIVTNSLSAMEAGKIDEVVKTIASAREGGFGGRAKLGIPGQAEIGGEGGRKNTASIEENLVSTRTRFSVFETWYNLLSSAEAIGGFTAWDDEVLESLTPGDTVEFSGTVELPPLQAVYRLFMWFADQAKTQGSPLAQKGEELKSTKEGERFWKMLFQSSDESETTVIAQPLSIPKPPVVMVLNDDWLIGKIGQIGGEYHVLAQVDKVVPPGEEEALLRVTKDAPPMTLEINVIKEAVGNMIEPSQALGASVTDQDAAVAGPAVLMTPIAIYR